MRNSAETFEIRQVDTTHNAYIMVAELIPIIQIENDHCPRPLASLRSTPLVATGKHRLDHNQFSALQGEDERFRVPANIDEGVADQCFDLFARRADNVGYEKLDAGDPAA